LQANGNGASDAAFALPHLRATQKVREAGNPPPAKGSAERPDLPGAPT
jgi:hypothetical protein